MYEADRLDSQTREVLMLKVPKTRLAYLVAFFLGGAVAIAAPAGATPGPGDCNPDQRCGAISLECESHSGRGCQENLLGDCHTVTECTTPM